jgi:hypothetical protein
LRKLNAERFTDFRNFDANIGRLDVPGHEIVLVSQKRTLDRLFHPVVLSRVLDSEMLMEQDAFRLGELFTSVQNAIWAETRQPNGSLNVNTYRRSLQREHLRKLMNMVLRDAAVPEDARSLARYGLQTLKAQLQRALAAPKMGLETRAHLAETISRIDEALAANLQRMAL